MTEQERIERRRRQERAKRNVKAGRHPREVLLKVPNAPLRERFLALVAAGQITASEAASTAGWRNGRAGDSQRLYRSLGIVPMTMTSRQNGESIKYLAREIEYETAVTICHALHADPPAVGV
jgi:hypothetical protein